jgi:hypothetical protein
MKSVQQLGLKGDKCRCSACGLYFNSTRAFAEHRVGRYGIDRRCLSSAELAARGMRLTNSGFWTTSTPAGFAPASLALAAVSSKGELRGGPSR